MRLALLLLLLLACLVAPVAAAPVRTHPDQDLKRLAAERLWGDELLFSAASRQLSADDQEFFAQRMDQLAAALAKQARRLPAHERSAYLDNAVGGDDGLLAELREEVAARAAGGELPRRPLRAPDPFAWQWPTEEVTVTGLIAIFFLTVVVYCLWRRRRPA